MPRIHSVTGRQWLVAWIVGATPAASWAAEPAPAPAPAPATQTASVAPPSARLSWDLDGGSRLTLVPPGDLYPRYLADPRRPRTGLAFLYTPDTEISGGGSSRLDVNIGIRHGFLRLSPQGKTDEGFQVDGEVGFFGQFNVQSSLDNVGWDGWYAVALDFAPGGPVRFKLANRHLSAHLGDEFVEKVGRERVNYTRQDFSLGVAWTPVAHWTVYGEPSYAYSLGSERLGRGAVQAGLQYDVPDGLWDGRAGYYAALDAQLFEDNGWHPNFTTQVGLSLELPGSNRRYRVGVEAHAGRSVLGEFFELDESYVSLGFWLDL